MLRGLAAVFSVVLLVLALAGCSGRAPSRAAVPTKAKPPAAVKAKLHGVTIGPKDLSFTQDGLHNCGTVSMLISWAHTYPEQAAHLVRPQKDGSFLVSPKGADKIAVTRDDLAAAAKARMVRTDADDRWAEIVLTAFVKWKCGPRTLDFKSTDWIYAGEIGTWLTGAQTGNYAIKMETEDEKGRARLEMPLPMSALKTRLKELRGKPLVAYTNRLVHIWAVLDYDSGRSRVLVRNPRSKSSVWMPVSKFAQRFQVLVYVE